jgi:hypothetical protein
MSLFKSLFGPSKEEKEKQIKLENEKKEKDEQIKLEKEKKEKEKKERIENNSKSSLLIKTKVKNIITGKDKVIELYDNRLVSEDNVRYFGGDGEFILTEFSNMKIETGILNRMDNKPWIGLSANRIYDDGSGGQDTLSGFIFIDPSEKKKLEKIIFYFENFRNGVEIKDLDKFFLESEKNEIDL